MAAVGGIRRAMLLDCCVSLSELAADLRAAAVSSDHDAAASIVQRLGTEVVLAAELVVALQRAEPFIEPPTAVPSPASLLASPVPRNTD
jgi:hypothetical protein